MKSVKVPRVLGSIRFLDIAAQILMTTKIFVSGGTGWTRLLIQSGLP